MGLRLVDKSAVVAHPMQSIFLKTQIQCDSEAAGALRPLSLPLLIVIQPANSPDDIKPTLSMAVTNVSWAQSGCEMAAYILEVLFQLKLSVKRLVSSLDPGLACDLLLTGFLLPRWLAIKMLYNCSSVLEMA